MKNKSTSQKEFQKSTKEMVWLLQHIAIYVRVIHGTAEQSRASLVKIGWKTPTLMERARKQKMQKHMLNESRRLKVE